MTQEWTKLKTLQEVVAAMDRGDEIQYLRQMGDDADGWYDWKAEAWHEVKKYRSRPKKRTETIILREALQLFNGGYLVAWMSEDAIPPHSFLRWLDTPAREVEVEE